MTLSGQSNPRSPLVSSRAWYSATIREFLRTQPELIHQRLVVYDEYSLLTTQRDAWLVQIDLLKKCLSGLEGTIYLEYTIPRMGRRVDTVLLIGPVLFVLEFKVGEKKYDRAALDQVWDYALDLKNFHKASHTVAIVPILIATEASVPPVPSLRADADQVCRPIVANKTSLRACIDLALQGIAGKSIEPKDWEQAPYYPTPTIVEAARALYAQHSVDAIARFDAGAQNLHLTSSRIETLIDEAKVHRRKAICFVTGVPGAGKTLVGLNIATQRGDSKALTHAVFLSGNKPLVDVLCEALKRDELARKKRLKEKAIKADAYERAKAFIQLIHHFRDEALRDSRAPVEHVAIFDEAQRAWNLKKTADFMRRKKKRPGFALTEPQFLISTMDRHSDWAFIVCLVGGGQEINTGEAGITEWLKAIHESYPHWHVYISSRLNDSEYAAGKALDILQGQANAHLDDSLHLAVSMRSFRAEHVSLFVKALLDCEEKAAKDAFESLASRYPLALTRDLDAAKRWIRLRARGNERYGMVASSKAMRLKPHAIDIRVNVNPVYYFLNDRDDVRSSYYLEDAATEFQIQGLELDWVCVTWDGDLRHNGSDWNYHDFRGNRWTNIKNEDNQRYLLNAYRVLLTRARQGMVIFVPPGDKSDPTRSPDYYSSTFRYLAGLGIPVLAD